MKINYPKATPSTYELEIHFFLTKCAVIDECPLSYEGSEKKKRLFPTTLNFKSR